MEQDNRIDRLQARMEEQQELIAVLYKQLDEKDNHTYVGETHTLHCSDGELVRGYDRYKNTIDGVEKVIDEGLQDDINLCPPGFYYDRVVESCMPIESLTDDTEAGDGPPNTIRPRPPIIPPNPDPTRPPVSQPISGGVTIRKPKFFRDGGSVTPNIDSFFSGMGR